MVEESGVVPTRQETTCKTGLRLIGRLGDGSKWVVDGRWVALMLKGKERKGQERRGQKRTGKEREREGVEKKGKERKGKSKGVVAAYSFLAPGTQCRSSGRRSDASLCEGTPRR